MVLFCYACSNSKKDKVFAIIEGNTQYMDAMLVVDNTTFKEKIKYTLADSLADGQWNVYFKDDSTKQWIEAYYKNLTQNGRWVYWYKNGNINKIETWENGLETGKWEKWYNNGNKSEVSYWEKGEMIGLWINWDINGLRMKERKFNKNGGKWTEWHTNNVKKLEGYFIDGFRHGQWKYFNKRGNLYKEEIWDKGTLIETKEYNEDGTLKTSE